MLKINARNLGKIKEINMISNYTNFLLHNDDAYLSQNYIALSLEWGKPSLPEQTKVWVNNFFKKKKKKFTFFLLLNCGLKSLWNYQCQSLWVLLDQKLPSINIMVHLIIKSKKKLLNSTLETFPISSIWKKINILCSL